MRMTNLFMLMLTSVMLTSGCGHPAPVSSTMTVKQEVDLNANLARLHTVLASKSPFLFAKLAPGATQAEINTLRIELSGAQIQCLEIWFRWHNGCTDPNFDLLPLGRMLSITETLQDRRDMKSIPFVDAKRRYALKILDDNAGDGYFLDIMSPDPRVFYDMLEDPGPTDFGTLEEFIAFVADVHDANLATLNQHGRVDFDLARYQVMENAYLARIAKSKIAQRP